VCQTIGIFFFCSIWVSPRLPALPEQSESNGESITGFKSDLIQYLSAYSLPILGPFIQRIRRIDMSSVM